MTALQTTETTTAPSKEAFSAKEAREIVGDLFQPNPFIYWTDFLASLTVGYTAASIYMVAPVFSAMQVACYFIAGFALYRVVLQMHEIVHMSGRQLISFRVAWNVLAGIPMLIPSYFYEGHLDHHTARHYGTGMDGEYLPLGGGTFKGILSYMSQVFFQPVLVVFRFLVLGPASMFHPGLRQWTLERFSSFTINLRYHRVVPKNANRAVWALMDAACFLRVAAMFAFPLAGLTSPTRIVLLYCLAVLVLTLNYLRTLSAHHYLSTGEPMSVEGQLLDSVNITGSPLLTELVYPVGLRYHALHHLFATLPYHNLGKAHRRLVKELPSNSIYRQTTYRSTWPVLRTLWRDIRQGRGERAREWYRHREEQLAEIEKFTRAAREDRDKSESSAQ